MPDEFIAPILLALAMIAAITVINCKLPNQ